jgi:hypothetical protein
MNRLSIYELSQESDLILKFYQEANGRQFVKVLKNRFDILRSFEVLNSDLLNSDINDNTLMLKEVVAEDL